MERVGGRLRWHMARSIEGGPALIVIGSSEGPVCLPARYSGGGGGWPYQPSIRHAAVILAARDAPGGMRSLVSLQYHGSTGPTQTRPGSPVPASPVSALNGTAASSLPHMYPWPSCGETSVWNWRAQTPQRDHLLPPFRPHCPTPPAKPRWEPLLLPRRSAWRGRESYVGLSTGYPPAASTSPVRGSA